MFTYGPILRFWELGFQQMNSEGTQFCSTKIFSNDGHLSSPYSVPGTFEGFCGVSFNDDTNLENREYNCHFTDRKLKFRKASNLLKPMNPSKNMHFIERDLT